MCACVCMRVCVLFVGYQHVYFYRYENFILSKRHNLISNHKHCLFLDFQKHTLQTECFK